MASPRSFLAQLAAPDHPVWKLAFFGVIVLAHKLNASNFDITEYKSIGEIGLGYLALATARQGAVRYSEYRTEQFIDRAGGGFPPEDHPL